MDNNVVPFDASRKHLPRALGRFQRSAQTQTFPVQIDGDVSLYGVLQGLLRVDLTIMTDGTGQGFVITKK